MATATATDAHGRTAAQRLAQRSRYEERAITQARSLYVTLRCLEAISWEAADPDVARQHHQVCRGESPGGGGCLCKCHDPVAEVITSG